MTETEKSTSESKWYSDVQVSNYKMKFVPSRRRYPISKDDMARLGRTTKMIGTVGPSFSSKWGLGQKDNEKWNENVEGIKKSSSAQDNNLLLKMRDTKTVTVTMQSNRLGRSNTMTGTKGTTPAAKWDHWDVGKKGQATERKINDQESIHSKADTTERLDEMRRLMVKDNLDY
jgi:hypothetical protein